MEGGKCACGVGGGSGAHCVCDDDNVMVSVVDFLSFEGHRTLMLPVLSSQLCSSRQKHNQLPTNQLARFSSMQMQTKSR